ncbi:alpha-L-arabinofuranosidase C-terminal domain-containing protein [Streptomyces sp. WI04-05B]|uniref:alpha-L-arabinofuranosidase C-terminal domain-containing protein n=1 Tax=Streptomyces TaxID=1883 RepID=UPI0029BC876F|nr:MULTISPECIES: alpha-L-arabinofuranosidase C-terminal domain-containing protein [unclassified Streptomyces]MDX2540828.1 alpha-L-arabinofuranosidase C-terminal domain-containing protein [Streptomyces sp. WI04-05B]MDX2585945.1 alpha-L-arabinofuranosidase C-terminal domain-containing protein [Streptomyces sp. WI04-05A]MDX3746021.1 alpha-L-arabinofuranosidase C-terminal domain-containing protein [Streptomyces sp. AK08-02]
MSRTRTRWRLGLTAAALLVVSAVVPAPANAEDVTDYAITVDPAAKGARIDDTMYGVFFEDINRAADGGLYAELVQNRSFEYSTADNRSYTPLTSWAVSGTATALADDGRLNARNRTYLSLGAGSSVTNSGYNTGIRVESGKKYEFSVWARADRATALTVSLDDTEGALAEVRQVAVKGGWAKYRARFTATRSSTAGRLTVATDNPVALDMVSLLPRDTYKGHGLRQDLAQKIAALDPGFVRFPGGCLVNTGSMQDYSEASNWQRQRSYQWKDTIGPVEQRATNSNFWGYNQSYGLGYYEYFQFSEDIGAMPLPVVPALVTGCGQNRAVVDEALLKRHVQDTLDLIEFANGPVTSEWGRKRAQLGHPKPFHLTHIEVGNEENLPNEFFARFTEFRTAIEAKYPDITVISNSGPDDSGSTFDTAWKLNRDANVDMVDEHYYNSTNWFLQNNDRYDSYDRNGPKVFLGEYASGGNTFKNALSEAAFMTGLERNADVVKLASYAPLLSNEDYVQWRPDMIWFNNHASWGSPSYEVQKLFMNNVGDRVVPTTATGTPSVSGPIAGAVGLSTWATTAAYDDVKVTGADGAALLSDDFSGDAAQWTHTGGGSWAVQDGQYVQTDVAAENTMVSAGDPAWHDYDLHVKATKKSGKEGFLVAFGVKDTGNYYWWNLGGWNNTQSAVEQASDGGKSTLVAKAGSIETGRAYDIDVKVRGRQVTLYLDGQEWGGFTDDKPAEPFRQIVTKDAKTGDLIVKVVNAQAAQARTTIDLGSAKVRSRAAVTTLAAAPDAVNTETAAPVSPVRSTFTGVARKFTYTFPANSVTFLRIKKG